MLKPAIDFVKKIIQLTSQTDKNTEDIAALNERLDELSAEVLRIAYEVRYTQANEAREREMILLRLENQLLKFQQHLPKDPREDG